MKLRVNTCYKIISSTEKKKNLLVLEKKNLSGTANFEEILQEEIIKQTK